MSPELVGALLAPLALLVFFVLPVASIVLHSRRAHEAREEELRALARGLDSGELQAPRGLAARLPACTVTGRLAGHAVRVGFAVRGPRKRRRPVALLEVDVPHPAATFDIAEAGLVDRLGRWLGFPEGDALGDGLVLREGAEAARQLIQARGIQEALRRLHDLHDALRVTLGGDHVLRVEARLPRGRVEASALRAALDVLVDLASGCARVPVTVAARAAGPRYAFAGPGGALRCPYCHDGLDPAGADAAACDRCGTAHHAACVDEAGGCAVFGCGARRRSAQGPVHGGPAT